MKAELHADAKRRWGISKKGAGANPRVVMAAEEIAEELINSGIDKEWLDPRSASTQARTN